MTDDGNRSGAWLPHAQLTRKQIALTAAIGVPLVYVAHAALFRRRKHQQSPTSFGAFLKEPAGVTAGSGGALAATDFGSFLKRAPAADTAASAQPGEDTGPPLTPDSVVVTILFGTEYGFSKEIAEKLRDALREMPPYWPRVIDMADHPDGLDLSREQALLVICSTQGDGVPPAEAREFCDWLCASDAVAPGSLQGKNFSVCALGDRSYEHFCAFGKMLDDRLEALGAARFVPRTDVNREDWAAVDGWLAGVTAGLKELPLKPAAETGHTAEELGGGDSNAAPRWGKSRPYLGRVVAIEGLCTIRSEDDKDTVRVEVDLGDSGIAYTPGDALGICPSNRPEDVEELLSAMGASGDEPVPRPGWPFREMAANPGGNLKEQLPLRAALTACYDIRAPKPELLQSLLKALPAAASVVRGKAAAQPKGPAAGVAGSLQNGLANGHANGVSGGGVQNGGAHAQPNGHANGLANGGPERHKQALTAEEQVVRLEEVLRGDVEAYLAPRHVADVLAEFPAAHLTTSEVLAGLRQLQPRLYSISSSQAEAEDRVQVTVAVVRYDALGKDRVGVTSTLLAERLQVGDTLPVYVSKNPDFRLPEDPATPIIMVGPGTGLAPFRAFMQERILRSGAGADDAGASVSGGEADAAGGPASARAASEAAFLSPREQAGSAAQTPRSFVPSIASSSSLADGGGSSGESGSGSGGEEAAGAGPVAAGAADAAGQAPASASAAAAATADADGTLQSAAATLQQQRRRLGPAMLFFGCRRPDQDFLYGQLLQGWADAGLLELHTAFSRQQAQKVYVQDRLREAGSRVWELLQAGGHFYVCGDAGGMAPAVQEALLDVITQHQEGGRAAAEHYLARLSEQGRYQRDVWLV